MGCCAQLTRQHLFEVFPDLAIIPETFDPRYRAFCWNFNGNHTCLPNLHVIGVSKCGTTDIARRLSLHKSFARIRNKGVHFYDELHTMLWYLKNFNEETVTEKTILLDASSNTFSHSKIGVRHRNNLNFTIADVFKLLFPKMKTVVMLRDPAERLYSSYFYYYHFKAYNNTPQGFHQYVLQELDKLKSCESNDYLCIWNRSQQFAKGIYQFQIDEWKAKSDLLVLKSEDCVQDVSDCLQQILRHIGVSEEEDTDFLKRAIAVKQSNTRKYNKGRSGNGEEMLPATRLLLNQFFNSF
jgi:hypothetical protein